MPPRSSFRLPISNITMPMSARPLPQRALPRHRRFPRQLSAQQPRKTLDELISFLGASYFRALGRNNIYGLSARGLADQFLARWPRGIPALLRILSGAPHRRRRALVIYAALESQSVTGAYASKSHPATTSAAGNCHRRHRAAVFPRRYQGNGRRPADLDVPVRRYQPRRLRRLPPPGPRQQRPADRDARAAKSCGAPSTMPPRWAIPISGKNNPHAFGLYQRGRDFENYQDAGAHYERRPSVRIEPVGDWGKGSVRLIEMPSQARRRRQYRRLLGSGRSGQGRPGARIQISHDLGRPEPDEAAAMAYVAETRRGHRRRLGRRQSGAAAQIRHRLQGRRTVRT